MYAGLQGEYLMQTDDEKEILRLAQLLSKASEIGDKTILENIISDHYVCTGSGGLWGNYGKFGNKTSAMKKWSVPPSPGATDSSILSNERAVVVDHTGVTSYVIVDKWTDEEGNHEVQAWVTDTWIKQNGNWKLLATHETIFVEK